MATTLKLKNTVVHKINMCDLCRDAETGTVEGFLPVCDTFEVSDEFIVAPEHFQLRPRQGTDSRGRTMSVVTPTPRA